MNERPVADTCGMDWRDEGILIAVRRHGESSAIIELFTAGHGRHAGVVRGGSGRRMTPLLQPGARLQVEWSARLEEHLGHFRVDPLGASTAAIMADPAALAALGSVAALLGAALPERDSHPALYAATADLVAALGTAPDWTARYAAWELALLADLGFGLDLSACALGGAGDDLAWVSPKSGRAVGRAAGAPWADRLLPLPDFLRRGWQAPPAGEEVMAALALTGHFLEARLAPALRRESLPAARDRAVAAIRRATRG
jgi:DNA repair protein RecO (recombination protein O)